MAKNNAKQLRRLQASVCALSIALTTAVSGAAYGQAVPAPPPSLPSYPQPAQAPKNAPNFLIIMTDDTGFGASSAFGGPVPTPAMNALAAKGLRYNRFNTTAMCSPTRAALMTGRNAHSVGFGVISEEATPDAGYNSIIPRSAATFGRILNMNGYDTAMIGKHHNVPLWEDTPIGPYDHWPNGLGFEYFYGFMAGAVNQFAPSLIENRNSKEIPQDDPSYILDKDMADRAIDWLNLQRSVRPDAPFAMYYAPGSTHSPHQAPPEWIAKFKGKFDQGWDEMRKVTYAQQKRQGVIPTTSSLTARPDEIPAWSSLTPAQRAIQARMMELYAAQLAYVDHEIGRIVQALKDSGQFDNTMIVFIAGDNGASLEGSLEGTVDEIARNKNRMPDSLADQQAAIAQFGTKHSWNNYPVGWAWAMNTPFRWGKAIASHLGAVRNGMIISWPGHLNGEGEVRNQFTHITDIAPTLYEVAGITPPVEIDGVAQMPIAGVSLAYTFKQPSAPSRHRSQYFELRENIAFYKDGWLASTEPRVLPWLREGLPPSDEPAVWTLYNLDNDFAQSRDLSKRYPAKLAELKAAFAEDAKTYNISRTPGVTFTAPRPFVTSGRTRFIYHNSATRYPKNAFANIMNKSWALEADIDVPAEGAVDGALIAQGSRLGGWGLVMLNGIPTFMYNASIMPRDHTRIAGTQALQPGAHKVRIEFGYDGDGPGKGGEVRLLVDGVEFATGRVPRTFGALLVTEGGATIGRDYGTTLSDDYVAPFIYPGTIRSVIIDLSSSDSK